MEVPAHSAWLAGQHPRGAQSAEIAMPRAFQRLAWLELLMVFGTVTEAGRISGTGVWAVYITGRVQAHARHMWPTGFFGVYEIDRDTSDMIVDFCTTAVEVESKVAYSGPNTDAKKEILNNSEASVCPPPITDMGLVNATNSLKMSTELRPSTPSEMREHRIHGTCSYVPLVLHPKPPLCPGFRPTVFMLGCRV